MAKTTKNWLHKYRFYIGVAALVLLILLAIAAFVPQKVPVSVKRDTAGRIVGDPTGRVLNLELSCADHCSGYAASGDEWCFCDLPCTKNKNCCSDFETACPDEAAGKPSIVLDTSLSCANQCSGFAQSEEGDRRCFCDANCQKNNNCCADFDSTCPELIR